MRSPEVVVDVQDVGEQALGRALLELQLLHPRRDHPLLASDLLPRSAHAEDPGKPEEEDFFNLEKQHEGMSVVTIGSPELTHVTRIRHCRARSSTRLNQSTDSEATQFRKRLAKTGHFETLCKLSKRLQNLKRKGFLF